MNKQELRKEIEAWIDGDTELTEEYMGKLNRHFFSMLKNPDEEHIETFRSIRDALILAWLTDLAKTLEKQLKSSNLMGYDEALEQLTSKDIVGVVNKKITPEKIKNMYKAKFNSGLADITYISQGIKVNSERAIKDIQNNVLSTKKAISTELATEFSEYGITYFTDTAGRRQNISNYVNKKSLTLVMDCMRAGLFYEAISKGVDLVKIVHLNIHPHCPLCAPFNNKILSISGKTEGYMTIDEAYMAGLWHAYCDDIPVMYELAPSQGESDIELNEQNKKRKEYNTRKGNKLVL